MLLATGALVALGIAWWRDHTRAFAMPRWRDADFVQLAAALAALALLSPRLAPPARALDPVPYDGTEDGWGKMIAYARCAFLVFTAVEPTGWTAAFFDCQSTYAAESVTARGGGS